MVKAQTWGHSPQFNRNMMKAHRIRTFLIITFLAGAKLSLAAEAPRPVSLIPCTRAIALQDITTFANKLKAYGVAPVNATPAQINSWGMPDAHPWYQFLNGQQEYLYDSCTGHFEFMRHDLARPLTKEEIKAQSVKWVDEAKVKTIANVVKDILLPDAKMEQFVPSDTLGALGSVENGVKVTKFMHANIAVSYYTVRQINKGMLGILRVEVDRITGQVSWVSYTNVKCDFDQAAVNHLLAAAKGVIADPVIRPLMDKWGCCQPVLTVGFGDQIKFLDLTDGKMKSFAEFYFASQNQRKPQSGCHIIHNGEMFVGEMFHPGNRLFFEPVVLNNAPLIAGVYFPRFEISLATKQDALTLTGLLPKTGKKAQLTLGSPQAVIDGKTITLSNAPQLIEGNLYLPYELLNLCNGILTRWEPKKNTLLVETRYLRRD